MKVDINYLILEPVEKVFNALIDPEVINKYFVTQMNGHMAKDQIVEWIFEDVGVRFDIKILALEMNKSIAFEWKASGQLAQVNIELTAKKTDKTFIHITEGDFAKDDQGITRLAQQTGGWTDFVCSMKAYLYAGVNLRSGKKY